ncbi:hypothetical protein PG987_004781 [Apiospora arundinis]
MAPLPLPERRKAFVRLVASRLLLARLKNQPAEHSLRNIIHPGGCLTALQHVELLLKGSSTQFVELFRLTKSQFWKLLDWLELHTGLESTRFQSSAQKLLVFLWICGFAEPQRNAAHRFLCAQSSVSLAFHTVLPKMVQLFQAFVKMPDPLYISPDVELVRKHRFDGFSGCIGAIDGTLIDVHLPESQQQAWRSRKGPPAQNVFCAVLFNTAFAYVLAGAEGSMHDNRLLAEALDRSFFLPEGRIFLADAGFGQRRGIILPFPETRYHLQEWKRGNHAPSTPEELYNLRHSRIRNVVERTFGIVKRKWKILRSSPPEYDLNTQIDIIYAVCGLWNFLIFDGVEPGEAAKLEVSSLTQREKATLEESRRRVSQSIGIKSASAIRRDITNYIWPRYLLRPPTSDSSDSNDSDSSDIDFEEN